MEHESVQSMWREYLDIIGENQATTTKKYTSWHFCDNQEDADELVQLVLQRIKRATASLHLSYEFENEEVPKVGDHCIITDWSGIAKCIIKMVKVDIVPYSKVTEDFAATEGEGDKSLDHWKQAHWYFFSREMEAMGKKPTEDMLVICEEFRVVYQ